MSPHISKRQTFGFECTVGSWYACSSGTRFVGCCAESNFSCSVGCSESNISPAFTNGPKHSSAYQARSTATTPTWTSTEEASKSSSATTTSTPSLVANTSATVTAAASTAQSALQDKRIIIVASTMAGGGLILVTLVGLIVCFVMHTKKSRSQHQDVLERRQSSLPHKAIEKLGKGGSSMIDAPPTYTAPLEKGFSLPPSLKSLPPPTYCSRHDRKGYPSPLRSHPPHQHVYRYDNIVRHELAATPARSRNTWQPQRPTRRSEVSSPPTHALKLEIPVMARSAFGTPKRFRRTVGEQLNRTTYPSRRGSEQTVSLKDDAVRKETSEQPGWRGYHAV